MDFTNINKQILEFNKNVFASGFQILEDVTEQSETFTNSFLSNAAYIPEENKKVFHNFFENSKKQIDTLKETLDDALEIDLMSQDAPKKSVDLLKKTVQSVFDNVSTVQTQSAETLSKFNATLPQEAQKIVKFCEKTVTGGLDGFKETVNKNLNLADGILKTNTVKPGQASKSSK
ncbi:MAG: hypothetical protein HQ517_06855 [SAR324 cluster bacterium]|nr:hypothetical protein [SAR324 cluster bacterium]